MVPEIFLCQEIFLGGHMGDITKSTRSIKCYARNSNHQNLYNPVTILAIFPVFFIFCVCCI